ncbi:PPE domain-containing protein [Nocardia sp. NPDC049707]|uniref:PPE domain-containing protein n=1 Tax=Nocardia sp. NPDC049707 TaxID=3154735 RepID=UPI0034416CAE
MPLDVDPAQLVAVASKLAALARDTGTGLPNSWVRPAGADPISGAHVPRLNAQAASLFNGVLGVLNEVQRHAHHIGGAATDYTTTDDQNARIVSGSGAEILANPVGDVQEFGLRQPPSFNLPAATGSVDPLTFAKQLHTGPGPGPATSFAADIRKYTGGFHAAAAEGVDGAAMLMQNWKPVGATVAEHLTEHRNWLGQLGAGLGALADNVDAYTTAFTVAKAKHPTPQEIIAARKRLLAAMKSKNELALQAALAEFQEQNARSAEAITGYSTTVNSQIPTEGGTSDAGGSGKGSSGGGNGGSSGSDTSMLSQMLPAMMNAMTSAASMGQNQNNSGLGLDDEYSDYGYDDLGIPSGFAPMSSAGGSPISGVGVPDISGAVTSVSVGSMPIVATAGAASSTPVGMARTPVIEPLSSASSAAAAARGAGAGNGMMPMMPMSPGMGGAGGGGNGNERNRVVAWHPDRLMYVDDTPHTEQVIGERPTIAPTVTPPTPTPGQGPTQSGGSM